MSYIVYQSLKYNFRKSLKLLKRWFTAPEINGLSRYLHYPNSHLSLSIKWICKFTHRKSKDEHINQIEGADWKLPLCETFQNQDPPKSIGLTLRMKHAPEKTKLSAMWQCLTVEFCVYLVRGLWGPPTCSIFVSSFSKRK